MDRGWFIHPIGHLLIDYVHYLLYNVYTHRAVLCVGLRWMWRRVIKKPSTTFARNKILSKENQRGKPVPFSTAILFQFDRHEKKKKKQKKQFEIWLAISVVCCCCWCSWMQEEKSRDEHAMRSHISLSLSRSTISNELEIWNWKIRSIQENNTLL